LKIFEAIVTRNIKNLLVGQIPAAEQFGAAQLERAEV